MIKAQDENGTKYIEIIRTTVNYKGNNALDDIDFTLYKGEHVALRGKNGAGKSTLLRLLRGEAWADSSKIYTNKNNVSSGIYYFSSDGAVDTSALCGREMAALVAPKQQENILSQAFSIDGEELIYGGLTDSIYILAKPENEDKEKILNLANALDCKDLLSRKVSELSQGQLRILLVMRALICEPKILLLDEVMDGLDEEARNALYKVLFRVSNEITIVFSTHRKELLPDWVGREIYMHDGRIVCDSRDFDCQDIEEEQNSESLARIKERYNQVNGAEIEIKQADVYIDSHLILKNIDWKIEKGEQWAIYGENGSGKSTLMRLLAGDEYPALGGSITRILGGELCTHLVDIKANIRLVSDLQQANYGYNLLGEEFVLSGIDNSVGLYREISDLERKSAEEALELLNISHLAKRSIQEVSTGEMRRLMLARAFIGMPKLLLLDEPFSGLDPQARENIDKIIEELCNKGVQIVYVSHYRSEIPDFIKHSIELSEGRIVSRVDR